MHKDKYHQKYLYTIILYLLHISALANAANSWRNELAHEKREYQPTVDVITAVRLIEHINYCIVFRHAGYNDEQIKSIIEEILVR